MPRDQQDLTIHLCVRKTLDWRDEALVQARINPFFRRKFEMWNATFALPYHVFRQRLWAMTERSLRSVEGAVISDLARVPPGDIVVPIDDDDWFAPDLAIRIRQHLRPDATGIVWGPATLEHLTPRMQLRRWLIRARRGRWRKYTCSSNNYAVRHRGDLTEVVLDHLHASRYVESHPAEFVRIPSILAVQNRSLASQTALRLGRPEIDRADLVMLFEAHRAIYQGWRPSEGLEWAVPYVSGMNDLMSELSLR
jgi:hypothetical protein